VDDHERSADDQPAGQREPGRPGSPRRPGDAYRAFAELLASPAAMLTVRLRPGDCAVFDNTRVPHARTGFAHGGHRHLQGCYADLDGIESAVAVGERATTDDTRRKDRI
jgi:hypothetical protein